LSTSDHFCFCLHVALPILSVFECYAISTYVLGNTSGLTSDNVCFSDIIQKGSFTVVNVPHYGNNWSSVFEVFRSVFYFNNCFFRSEEHTSELQSRENLVCR